MWQTWADLESNKPEDMEPNDALDDVKSLLWRKNMNHDTPKRMIRGKIKRSCCFASRLPDWQEGEAAFWSSRARSTSWFRVSQCVPRRVARSSILFCHKHLDCYIVVFACVLCHWHWGCAQAQVHQDTNKQQQQHQQHSRRRGHSQGKLACWPVFELGFVSKCLWWLLKACLHYKGGTNIDLSSWNTTIIWTCMV